MNNKHQLEVEIEIETEKRFCFYISLNVDPDLANPVYGLINKIFENLKFHIFWLFLTSCRSQTKLFKGKSLNLFMRLKWKSKTIKEKLL